MFVRQWLKTDTQAIHGLNFGAWVVKHVSFLRLSAQRNEISFLLSWYELNQVNQLNGMFNIAEFLNFILNSGFILPYI